MNTNCRIEYWFLSNYYSNAFVKTRCQVLPPLFINPHNIYLFNNKRKHDFVWRYRHFIKLYKFLSQIIEISVTVGIYPNQRDTIILLHFLNIRMHIPTIEIFDRCSCNCNLNHAVSYHLTYIIRQFYYCLNIQIYYSLYNVI